MQFRVCSCFALFLVQLSLWLVAAYEETFYGSITADNIYYAYITIPRHSFSVSTTITIEKGQSTAYQDIKPKVLMRYNGVPTPSLYDDILDFPTDGSNAITLIDNQPTASILYLGIWGGELLHSYRYFSGSPVPVSVIIQSTIQICENDFAYYNPSSMVCESMVPLITVQQSSSSSSRASDTNQDDPASDGDNGYVKILGDQIRFTASQNLTGSLTAAKSYSMIIPSNLHTLVLELQPKFDSFIPLLCIDDDQDTSVHWTSQMELFLDQSDEEMNYYSVSSQNITLNAFCNFSSPADLLTLKVPLPLPGIWILRVSTVLYGLADPSQMNRIQNNATMDLVLSSNYELNYNLASNTEFSSYLNHPQLGYSIAMMKSVYLDPAYLSYTATHLWDYPPNPLIGPKGMLFLVPFMNSDKAQLLPNGRAFQLVLKFDYSLEVGSSALQSSPIVDLEAMLADYLKTKKQYVVSCRMGNLPFNPNPAYYEGGEDPDLTEKEYLLRQSLNAFELLTQEAQLLNSFPLSSLKPTAHNTSVISIRVVYKWTLLYPAIPMTTTDVTNDNLFLLLTEDDSSSSSTTSLAEGIEITGRKAMMNVVLGFCPPDSCAHGICFVESNYFPTSVCYCKYPWASERCDTLTESQSMYLLQVLTLVLTNLCMIPAIAFAYAQQLYIIMIGLTFAMASSFFYHFCDTDYYCLFDLSFQTLQVMDILFSDVMIIMIILFYAPFSERLHSIVFVVIFGLLLSMTVNRATNPMNIVFSFTLATLILALSWLYYACCFYSSTTRRDSLFGRIKDKFRLTPDRRRQRKPARISSAPATSSEHNPLTRDVEMVGVNIEEEEEEDNEEMNPLRGSAEQDRRTASSSHGTSSLPRRRSYQSIHSPSNLFYYHRNNNMSSEDRYSEDVDSSSRSSRSCSGALWQLRSVFIGAVLGIVGLTSFATQNRQNYWLVHSGWHVCMMFGCYFLLKGKYEFFQLIKFTPIKLAA